MLNVNKITSMLAKMPDPQLQQYAQMHKNDPYIMALAMSESNRRKEVRAATPPMAEQPKVVDQEIAQMGPQRLPEDQGIGQLPAGNMNFAGGGIIAFDEGGEVERYQSRGLVQPNNGVMYDPITGVPISSENVSDNDLTMFESLGIFNPANRRALEKAEKDAAFRAANPTLNKATMPAAGYTRTDPRAAAFAESVKAINTAPAAAANLNPAAPGGKLPAQAGLGNLDVSKLTETALATAAKQPNPFAADVTKIGEERVKAKEAEVAGLEAIQKQYSDIFKGRKERLDKKEGDIETMKDQGLGLALLQAGAAMMTTPGGIGAAVGKGVDVGSKQYAAGIDRVRSAQEKLSDARDRLEEIEANRGEMSARELLKAQNEVKTAGIGAREDLLKANMQMYNVNRETALKMVDNQVKVGLSVYEQQQANARTQMQVSAQRDTPDRIVFNQLLKANNNDAVKAAESLQKMKAEKFNMYEAYSKYLTGFAGKDTLTPPLAFDQFASQFAIPTTRAPGKGATVLTQP
jgi:hypothetical protein